MCGMPGCSMTTPATVSVGFQRIFGGRCPDILIAGGNSPA
jgi:hypothetical protein